MNSDRSSLTDIVARDVESYRKFLAGGRTQFAQAFWETRPPQVGEEDEKGMDAALEAGVEDRRN